MLVKELGLIEYNEALRIQEAIRDEVIASSTDETLIICEHPNVITIGRALGAKDEVFETNIPIFEVSRGGRSTLHLPGQIVIYPIINIQKRGKDLHGYLRTLEDAIIETLGDFRIEAKSEEGKTGVWVGMRKIASLGVAVKKWVSYHGIALNVNCDLKLFSNLSPCGFSADVMTSVEREMGQEYRKTWKLTDEILFKRIKKRLVENLKNSLDFK